MFILMNNCETQNLRFLGQLVSEICPLNFTNYSNYGTNYVTCQTLLKFFNAY